MTEVTREEFDQHNAAVAHDISGLWQSLDKIRESETACALATSTTLTTINQTLGFIQKSLEKNTADVAKLLYGNGEGPIPYRVTEIEKRVSEIQPLRHRVANVEQSIVPVPALMKEVEALKIDNVRDTAKRDGGRITSKDVWLILLKHALPQLMTILGLGIMAYIYLAWRGLGIAVVNTTVGQ